MSSITPNQINGHNSSSCPHLAAFRHNHGSFRSLQDCLRVRPFRAASVRRDPHELPRCNLCRASRPTRLLACVSYASVHCHSSAARGDNNTDAASHAAAHAADAIGHEIAVDVDRAELFCGACGDQVYDRDFDAAVVLATMTSSSGSSSAAATHVHAPENLRKRRRIDYKPWTPDLSEQMVVGRGSSLLHGRQTEAAAPLKA